MFSRLYFRWLKFRLDGYPAVFVEKEIESYIAKQDYVSLVRLLQDDDGCVRYYSLERLSQLGDRRAIQPVLEMLKGSYHNLEHAERVLRILGATKEQMVDCYLAFLPSVMSRERERAIKMLVTLGDKRAIEPLLGLLSDTSVWRVSFCSLVEDALAQLGASKEQMINGNVAALSSEDNVVRYHAAKRLISVGGYHHADVIEKLLQRDPGASARLLALWKEAVAFKQQGYDFRVVFRPAVIGSVELGGHSGPWVEEEEVLYIERGAQLD